MIRSTKDGQNLDHARKWVTPRPALSALCLKVHDSVDRLYLSALSSTIRIRLSDCPALLVLL